MKKKYCFTDEKITINGRTLHRIQALKDFGDVKAGTLGGFIEKEENLSQEREAWVNGNACVFGDARIYDNAQIFGNASISDNVKIFEDACVCGDAWIYNNVQIYGNALICNDTQISGNAQIYEEAQISGNAWVYGNAKIYGHAWVGGHAKVYGNTNISNNAQIFGTACVYGDAKIRDKARVFGNAQIRDEAIISQHQYVSYGSVEKDLSKTENLINSIKAQCNLLAIDNKVIAYKLVRPNLTSFYDENFQYEVGKEIEVKDCNKSDDPCSDGLHFSNPTYWEYYLGKEKYVYLEAEIDLNDIITVQQGKIRCRKAKILRSFSL